MTETPRSGGTFNKTGIDFEEKDRPLSPLNGDLMHDYEYKIPSAVNFTAIRESFLAEAPFVKKGSKGLWRKIIDGKNFGAILASTYSLLTNCISDAGSLNVQRLRSMDNPQLTTMGKNLSDMFYFYSRLERDSFLPKLPEVMTYLVVNCLHTGIPKHYRMYNSIRFREILLDWFSEMYGGFRLSSCRSGRQWLFDECLDIPIFLTSPDTKITNDPKLSSASSRFALNNSPLVSMYMGPHLSAIATNNSGIKITMSHLPARPMMTLRPETHLIHGKGRVKHFNTLMVKQTLNESKKITTKINKTMTKEKSKMHSDVRKFKEMHDMSLTWIQKEQNQKMAEIGTGTLTGMGGTARTSTSSPGKTLPSLSGTKK